MTQPRRLPYYRRFLNRRCVDRTAGQQMYLSELFGPAVLRPVPQPDPDPTARRRDWPAAGPGASGACTPGAAESGSFVKPGRHLGPPQDRHCRRRLPANGRQTLKNAMHSRWRVWSSLRILTSSVKSPNRASSNPRPLPAALLPWQGQPATIKSIDPSYRKCCPETRRICWGSL
jgi:hypothetical protein